MRRGPKAPLTLMEEERETLERWARRPTTAQALAQRARIVLACVRGRDNSAVAVDTRVTRQTVGRWRRRFVAKRVTGLLDEPRPGAPRKITDEAVEHVVRLTLENTPRDATHRSTRAMARRCGLSQTAVSRIWRTFALQPHRVETFIDLCISNRHSVDSHLLFGYETPWKPRGVGATATTRHRTVDGGRLDYGRGSAAGLFAQFRDPLA